MSVMVREEEQPIRHALFDLSTQNQLADWPETLSGKKEMKGQHGVHNGRRWGGSGGAFTYPMIQDNLRQCVCLCQASLPPNPPPPSPPLAQPLAASIRGEPCHDEYRRYRQFRHRQDQSVVTVVGCASPWRAFHHDGPMANIDARSRASIPRPGLFWSRNETSPDSEHSELVAPNRELASRSRSRACQTC